MDLEEVVEEVVTAAPNRRARSERTATIERACRYLTQQ
jgi:hypothetical protein